MSVQQDKFKEIADRIRAYLYTDDLIKPNDFAGKIDEVSSLGFNDGRAAGFGEGVDEGIVRGKVEAENEMLNYGMSLSEALTSGDSNIDGLEANINQAKSDITAIKTLIENHGVEVPVGTLSSTYDETLEQIITDEKDAGIEQGKQSAYDEFWDSYQDNGERTNYNYAFAAPSWNINNFKPKYDIIPTACNSLFTNIHIEDVEQAINDAGIEFNTSKSEYMGSIVTWNYTVKVLPELSFEGVSSIDAAFNTAKALVTIRKLILKEDGSQTINRYIFNACSNLQNIIIEGTIGDSFYVKESHNLTVDSMKSIITHLKDYSGTETDGTKTIKFSGTALNNLIAEGATSPNGNLWTEYINDLGWLY